MSRNQKTKRDKIAYESDDSIDDEMAQFEDHIDAVEEERSKAKKGVYAWSISLMFHFFLIVLLSFIIFDQEEKADDIVITTTNFIEENEEKVEKIIDVVKEKVEVEDPVIVETPIVVVEEVVEEVMQTENEMETETAEGISEAISDMPLVGSGLNGNIGGGSGGGGAFGQRSGGGKRKALMRNGGSKKTESAVDRALRWLKRHQDADGSWHIEKWEGGARQFNDVTQREGVSGLALLAFLGAGHTHKLGEYKNTVNSGVSWIISRQNAEGQIIAKSGHQAWEIYDHAICTLMLAELYAMTGDKIIQVHAQKALDYLMSKREADGSWQHSRFKSTSVLGWCVMAMKSGKIAGLNLPPDAFSKSLERLESVTEMAMGGSYYGKVGYTKKGSDLHAQGMTMTVVGMLAYQYLGKKRHDLEYQAKLIIANLPKWIPNLGYKEIPQNFYHWYYGTLAMFQMGGDYWKNWNKSLIDTLLPTQRIGGPLDGSISDVDGSWDPVTTYDDLGGRVYSTAMGALNLEVYYRYKSVFE